MKRRNLLKRLSLASIAGLFMQPAQLLAETKNVDIKKLPTGVDDRKYWVDLLDRIASPLLSNMSKGTLRKNMDMQVSPIWDNRDIGVGYLEALGRLAVGMAPWLALQDVNTEEAAIQARLKRQLQESIAHGVNPKSPDYLSWNSGSQPLVDAAFLAQSLLKAPEALWEPLSDTTKTQVIYEFKQLRRVKPYESNWLLFAAMIETFLLSIGEEIQEERIDDAITKINEWYKGDGWYGDGPIFSFDYYNSYVIQPMLVDVLKINVKHGRRQPEEYDLAYKRMQRYAEFLERMVSPEGTYPIFGRSATYRTAIFQPLAQLALEDGLPEWIKPSQVRCAITAVKRRIFIPESFVNDKWLSLGIVGDKQTGLADSYSNTGSMYLTSLSFLPLGLPEKHLFWSASYEPWTMLKAWKGEPFKKDYHVNV
ncbi:MAG TPA: DUF2264 domain-containing protein [Pseudosphingobacterium sp.]|nr:DUF2264 domain-containing protein [Pseudosphingobacterium sp.]